MLFACGAGDAGQLGTGKRETELLPVRVSVSTEGPIAAVACGTFHTCVLTSRGSLWASGGNSQGQLGTGTKKSTTSFVPIEALNKQQVRQISCGQHTAAVTSDGELYVWGTGVFGESLLPQKLLHVPSRVKQAVIGGCFGTALDESGKIWTWGTNTTGELGLGDYDPRTDATYVSRLQGKAVVSVSCGGAYAIALGVTHTGHKPGGQSRQEAAGKVETWAADAQQVPIDATQTSSLGQAMQEPKKTEEGDQGKSLSSLQPNADDREMQDSALNPRHEQSLSEPNNLEPGSSISQRDPNQPVRRHL